MYVRHCSLRITSPERSRSHTSAFRFALHSARRPPSRRQGSRCGSAATATLLRSARIVVLLLSTSLQLHAQAYRAINYGNEEGLPTDLTKAIVQDSDGVIWIGTDAGLVRFDGLHFRTFDKELPSPFVKRLMLTRSGDLLVVTDRGIGFVDSQFDHIAYRPLIIGRSTITDTTTAYPKAVFEAADGSLWISESDAIIHWENRAFRRFRFDDRFRSGSYVRSFLVTQDDHGRIIATAENGSVFLFDTTSSSFRRLAVTGAKDINGLDALLKLKSGTILLGCRQGIYAMTLDPGGTTALLRQRVAIPRVSSLVESNDGELYAGTWRTGVYIFDLKVDEAREIRSLRQRVINDLALTATGRLLVSADEGVCIAQKSMFEQVPLSLANYFIQGITDDGVGGVYVTDGQTVFQVTKKRSVLRTKVAYRAPSNQLTCLSSSKEGVWMGCREDLLRFLPRKGSVRTIALPKYGSGQVSAVFADREGGVWLCRNGLEGVEQVLPGGGIRDYTQARGLLSHINVVRETEGGRIVAGGVGDTTHLYLYDRATDAFVNISGRLPQREGLPFSVNDLVAGRGDTLWLATDRGLYRYVAGRIDQDPGFAAIQEENLKSIALDKNGDVWLGTERGVVRYHDGDVARYDGRDGLSSMTMSYRAMTIGPDGRIWVGTANGASCGLWNPESAAPVRAPRVLSVQADQFSVQEPHAPLILPFSPNIAVTFVSMSYPQDRILYQHRLPGLDQRWSVPSHATELRLTGLEGGQYTLEIRAKREGGNWTEPTSLLFEISPPWYRRWWAFCCYGVIIAGLVYGVGSFAKLRREKKTIEEEIRKSEKKYRTIFENVQDIFYLTNLAGTITEISPSIIRYAGVARSELLGRSIRDLFFTRDDWDELVRLLLAKGEVTDLEVQFAPQGRQPMVVSVNAHVVLDANDDAVGIEGSLRDITERKRAQERIEATLHEKEMLLKEIHHRVKNNMQVISSLLSLQASEARDSAAREGLIDSQHRVRSMALVHEKLYRSANLSDIDFGEYLKSVIGELARSYQRESVHYSVEVDPVHLGIDVAIPCGLIVNELVSNAFKHAFPDNRRGTIGVTLRRRPGGGIQLRVSDDGVGIPADKDPREMTSMGMGIVYALTDQISANVTLDRGEGTTFIVDFKE